MSGIQPRASVPLAPFTTLDVGGPAQWFAMAATADHLPLAHAWAADRGLPLSVLGGGSNLVIADEGVPGLVLHVDIRGAAFDDGSAGTIVRAGAGEPWDGLVAAVVGRGLAGIECLSGIPGRAGGTPIQNVGAYGQEIADTIERVTAFDRIAGQFVQLAAADCGFSYRQSRFKTHDDGRFIVSEVTFRLHEGEPSVRYPDVIAWLRDQSIDRPSLQNVRAAVLAIRRRKSMVVDEADPNTRSVGSFFTNPVVTEEQRAHIEADAAAAVPGFVLADGRVKIPAAWLIERAGFQKGHVDGAAGISTRHPLALINRGGARACDVLRLAARIKGRVMDRFGVSLRPEPVFVGFGADPGVEYLRRA